MTIICIILLINRYLYSLSNVIGVIVFNNIAEYGDYCIFATQYK